MHFVLIGILLLAAVIGPAIWVKRVMQRYSRPADRYPGTGGELARHLLDSFGLTHVGTETSQAGDHYDPRSKTVRLTPENFDSRSLTAITVAAHEVGHALQDAEGYGPLRWRSRLVQWVGPFEKVGAGLLLVAPFTLAATRMPGIGLLTFLGGFLTLASSVVIHFVTLPTELDASFARALPILNRSGILLAEDKPHARRLLTAAALTYVSASLASLVNIARWWAILRR